MKNRICVAIIFCFAISEPSFAYKESTHRLVNDFVLPSNLVYLDDLLKNKLGFPKGVDTKIGKTLRKWLEEGGALEDKPVTRAFNHFLDPTVVLSRNLFIPGYPTVAADDWALNTGDPQRLFEENMSWPAAIEYFRIGVTGRDSSGNEVAATKDERDATLAEAFRALGQVMHLVEDMSVPAHTRLDIHLPYINDDLYEVWCNENPPLIADILNSKSDYFLPPPYGIGALADVGYAPISRILVDDVRELFDGSITWGQICTSGNLGLAEYSNCNFPSRDTLANSRYDYYQNMFNVYPNPQFSMLVP
jgi:hypothetical protein